MSENGNKSIVLHLLRVSAHAAKVITAQHFRTPSRGHPLAQGSCPIEQGKAMARIRISLPDSFVFRTEVPIRIDDINYGGHLGNDAVLTLVHEARVRFFKQLGFTELNIGGLGILAADAAIEYRSEGFYGDILRVEIGVTDISRKGCDIVYRCTNRETGVEIARVKTGIVFFDPSSRKVVRIPNIFLNSIDRLDSSLQQ